MEFKFLILIVVITAILIILKNEPQVKYTKVTIGSVEVNTEIADTPLKHIKGLMFRKSLPENNGMLFIFNNEDYYNFWMVNTTIPLDMIWINRDMEIVHIEKNTQPCFINCKIYSPKEKAKYVLEANAGFVDKHKIEVGHFIELR